MNLLKLVTIWLSVIGCWSQIITKSTDLSSLAELTMEILSFCYEKEVNTVGIAGTSYNVIIEMLSSNQSLSIALIGNDTNNVPTEQKLRYKLQLFIVIVSSSNELNQILRQIKISHWWNHMATYLILDWYQSNLETGCSNAFSFLWTAWQMNLLKGFYVCLDPRRGRLIYSYNPYTNKAPKIWQLENTYKDQNNRPWSLFQRKYNIDKHICKNLEFDKTTDLGGYEIYSTAKNFLPGWYTYVNKIGTEQFGGHAGRFARVVFHALNANVHLKVHDVKYPGLSDSSGRDIAVDTTIGISDILLIPRLYLMFNNYTLSYGFRETGICIMTQHSGQQTQLEKLINVLDKSSRIFVGLAALTTVIFFKFYLRQTFVSAILNVLRISANSNLTKLPKNQSARIYLAVIFILVVHVIGIYQGQLASLLTKSKPLSNVQSMQDLADRGYIIYSHKMYANLFSDPIFQGRFRGQNYFNCTNYVLRNPRAACIRPQMDLIEEASKFKLHLSPGMIIKTSFAYVIRKDWPLEERFNIVLAALTEADVPRLTLEKDTEKILKIARYQDNQDKIQKFKVITLNELTFAFAFLGIGLACASVCFIVEVIIWKHR